MVVCTRRCLNMQNEDIDRLFTEGFFHTLDENIDVAFFDQFQFPDCDQEGEMSLDLPEFGVERLRQIHDYLEKEYVSKIFPEYEKKEFAMWNGVDAGSARWHNDYEDGDPFNLTFLIYLDNNTPENGNHISISGPGCETTVYPKRGTMICLNQKKIFKHKACHYSGMRRLIGFEFFVPALA